MDIDKYFKTINEATDNMSDTELERLLIESGLEECPYEDKSPRGLKDRS